DGPVEGAELGITGVGVAIDILARRVLDLVGSRVFVLLAEHDLVRAPVFHLVAIFLGVMDALLDLVKAERTGVGRHCCEGRPDGNRGKGSKRSELHFTLRKRCGIASAPRQVPPRLARDGCNSCVRRVKWMDRRRAAGTVRWALLQVKPLCPAI